MKMIFMSNYMFSGVADYEFEVRKYFLSFLKPLPLLMWKKLNSFELPLDKVIYTSKFVFFGSLITNLKSENIADDSQICKLTMFASQFRENCKYLVRSVIRMMYTSNYTFFGSLIRNLKSTKCF